MKKKYLLLSFIFISALVRGESFDLGLYSININKKINVPGAKIYINSSEERYIELQSFLKSLGITNNTWIDDEYVIDSGDIYRQERVLNLKNKSVAFRGKVQRYKDEIVEKDEKIYVKIEYLKNLIDLKTIETDEEKLRIDMETKFKLPIELANIRKSRQEEFKNREKKNIKKISQEKRFFEPGNLRLIYDYNKELQANNSESKRVDGEYLGQVFYGDFETYYGIYPEVKNYQTRLTYRNVYKDHSIVFGDMSTKLPKALSGTVGDIRGISFVKDYNLIGDYTNNSVTISGYAPLGKFVELYQNNKLISYVDVSGGRYSFDEIPLLFSSDMFYVVIHNLDGSIKREYLNRYYGEKPEKKGEFGFNVYTGESSYDRYDQFIGEVNYGLTDRITLKTGYYDLKYNAFYGTYNPQDNQSLKLGVLYSSDYSVSPYTFEIDTMKNSKESELDITYKYNQIFTDYRLSFEGGDYSGITAERINKDYEFSGEVSKNKFFKDNVTVGLKSYSTKYANTGKKLDELGVLTRVNFDNLTTEYGVYKDITSGNIYHDLGIRSYQINNILLYAGISHRDIGVFDETRYKFEVMNRGTGDSRGRYKIFYEKSDRYGDIFGLNVDIDYNNWFTGRGEYRKSNGKSSLNVGYTLDKVINLSDPNTEIINVENSSVSGRVYLDVNNNKKYDKEIDKVLPRTEILVSGKSAVTDKEGLFKIYNISPNISHEIKFISQNPIYKGVVDSYKIIPIQASDAKIDIPMYTRKIVSGEIKFENNELKNKYLTTLYLTAYNKLTNEKIEIVIPENDGFFIINNLISGEYILTLESVNNPGVLLGSREIIIKPETKEMNLELNIGGAGNEEENKLVVAFAIAYNNN
ncbi:MAG: hypothetical protein ACRC4T_23555 [Cetobacterium sp.]